MSRLDRPAPGTVWIQDRGAGAWLRFADPLRTVEASLPAEVAACLETVEAATADGLWAAGFLAYEAAPAFDRAFATRPPADLPLAWFGIYRRREEVSPDWQAPTVDPSGLDLSRLAWRPSIDREVYRRTIDRIREEIACGETYQVNFSFRLRAAFDGDAWRAFGALCHRQRRGFGAFVDLGEHALGSVSPELFFRLDGERITTRPMKGTARRGRTSGEDEHQAAWLAGSEKNRAENLMIVDMMRNDLGRIATPGSVAVRRLFDVERYDSLFQMTSTVEARTTAPLTEILAALFPSASITGAPKVRTMELIAEIEESPRGIYTGTIGYAGPERQASFNVAIRTLHLDRGSGVAEYGTGGGIVWDSEPEDEYRECATKALVLTAPAPRFRLLETLLWSPEEGYVLLERHLSRLTDSARYFDFSLDIAVVSQQLSVAVSALPRVRHRVRLLLAPGGGVEVESRELETSGRPWRVAVARRPVDRRNRLLFHKTTAREIYDRARAEFPSCDDVLLTNLEGELTESTVANLVVCRGDELLTPALDCGLLPGTRRAELLATGEIREAVLRRDDLDTADEVYLVNSVRGRIPIEIVTGQDMPLGTGDSPAG